MIKALYFGYPTELRPPILPIAKVTLLLILLVTEIIWEIILDVFPEIASSGEGDRHYIFSISNLVDELYKR